MTTETRKGISFSKNIIVNYHDQDWKIKIKQENFKEAIINEKHINRVFELNNADITDEQIEDIIGNACLVIADLIQDWDLIMEDGSKLPIPASKKEFADLISKLGLEFWVSFIPAYQKSKQLSLQNKKK